VNQKEESMPVDLIREVERDVTALKISVGQLGVSANSVASQISHLQVTVTDLSIQMAKISSFSEDVENLQQTVNTLSDALNRARGAVYAFTVAATLVGAVLGMIANAAFRLIGHK
jgi:hypothetical protein